MVGLQGGVFVSKNRFALLLASTLLIPQVSLGNDSTVGIGSSPASGSWRDLALPAVPHEMMVPQTQVLSTKVSQAEALSGLNVDALEIFDMLGSFVVQP